MEGQVPVGQADETQNNLEQLKQLKFKSDLFHSRLFTEPTTIHNWLKVPVGSRRMTGKLRLAPSNWEMSISIKDNMV